MVKSVKNPIRKVTQKTANRKMASRTSTHSTLSKENHGLSFVSRSIVKWTVSLLVIIALGSGLYFYKYSEVSHKVMPIRVVEIEGELKHITHQQILDLILSSSTDASQSTGEIGFFSTDLKDLENKLEILPWLQTAEIRRVWPDRLAIKVEEQKALARWNKNSLINTRGKIFTPLSLTEVEDIPQLNGDEQELSKLLDTFKDLQLLFEAAELQLKVLTLNRRYSWSLVLTNGIQLQIGRTHLKQRVKRFISLYPLLQRESKLPIAKVDLRYDTGLAVTRLETSELQASL